MVQVVRKFKHSGQVTAAGILTIISSCLCLVLGIIAMIYLLTSYYYPYYPYYIFIVIFGILGFGFGLTGGIYILKRKIFALGLVGVILVIIAAVVSIPNITLFILLGIPIVIMAIISLTFIATFKHEFSS